MLRKRFAEELTAGLREVADWLQQLTTEPEFCSKARRLSAEIQAYLRLDPLPVGVDQTYGRDWSTADTCG